MNQYMIYAGCPACSTSCKDSVCRRDSDCSLCVSPICSVCESYDICLVCLPNAELTADLSCECKVNFYWDLTSLSCNPCQTVCFSCTGPALEDCICGWNSVITTQGCRCNQGFFTVDGRSDDCMACDSTCLECSGAEFYECLTCVDNFLEGICLEECPSGYTALNNACVVIDSSGSIMNYTFDSPMQTFYDEIQGIPAGRYKSKVSSNSTGPITAFGRGIYFSGDGSYLLLPDSTQDIRLSDSPQASRLFGVRFFISTWIRPLSSNSTLLLYEDSQLQSLFSLRLSDLYLDFLVQVDLHYTSYLSGSPLFLDEWNHILLAVDYTQGSTCQLYVNSSPKSPLVLSPAPFMDDINSILIIGADGSSLDGFSGFLYSLQMYVKAPAISGLSSVEACGGCLVCFPSKKCIIDCEINEFYNATTLQCSKCSAKCSGGCTNGANCAMCIDSYCTQCSGYEINSCTHCETNYEVRGGACIACNSTSYYDSLTSTCIACANSCTTCTSSGECLVCVANSYLNSANQCECDLGYSQLDSLCTRNLFYAAITISPVNQVTITFTEALAEYLSTSDLEVMNNTVPLGFTVGNISGCVFEILPVFTTSVSPGDKLSILFTNPVVSVGNSLLANTSFSIELFAAAYNATASLISQAKYLGQSGLISGAGAVLASSLFTQNPALIFSFMNNLEIYTYTSLYQDNLDEVITSFLNSLSPNSKKPNPFTYFVNLNDQISGNATVKYFKSTSYLIIINSGFTLFVFTILIVIFWLALVMRDSKNPWLKKQVWKVLGYYRYRVFLRFFVQSFLELSTTSLIGILHNPFQTAVDVIDYLVCLTFAVIFT